MEELNERNCVIDSQNKARLSLNIVVREEKEDGKKVVIVNNEELGIADFGENLDEAIFNFKSFCKNF